MRKMNTEESEYLAFLENLLPNINRYKWIYSNRKFPDISINECNNCEFNKSFTTISTKLKNNHRLVITFIYDNDGYENPFLNDHYIVINLISYNSHGESIIRHSIYVFSEDKEKEHYLLPFDILLSSWNIAKEEDEIDNLYSKIIDLHSLL